MKKRRRTENVIEDTAVAASKKRVAPAPATVTATAPAPTPAKKRAAPARAPAPEPAPAPAPALAPALPGVVAANTEKQAAQVLAAQEAGFGPHEALQITGVQSTPELNGLLCQMEDLRKHQAHGRMHQPRPAALLAAETRPLTAPYPSTLLSILLSTRLLLSF